jgi:hypothetical protein
MKATELKIGNFLIELGNAPDPLKRIFRITAIYGRDAERFVVEDDNGDIMSASFLQPIPLTEEWLLKFGIEKTSNSEQYGYYIELSDKSFICWAWSKDVSIENYKGDDIPYVYCEYVHQLQNLYFALTGNELEIKE